MLLVTDQRYEFPTSYLWRNNYADANDEAGRRLASDDCSSRYERDFNLTKGWTMNGEEITGTTIIEQGSVLDYTLRISHSGRSSYAYDALPLVDHMTGAQALLAPVSLNSGADWAENCRTVTQDGTEYYILSAPGTYSHVWTGKNQMADSVTVTATDSGLDTLTKWYFTNYSGYRTDTVGYRAYVCPRELLPEDARTYSLDNEVWLNDHQSHRLYDSDGWSGAFFRIDKKIVDEVGDTDEGYRYSSLTEAQTVTYRLMLQTQQDADGNYYSLTIHGNEMEDMLPLSMEGYSWDEDKVEINYMDETENYHVVNGDSWSITTSGTEAGSNQQYIRWNPDFSITLRGTAYIYVTLQFPSGTQWQEYARKYGATNLVNTYYVLNLSASVTQNLSITAEARLQKGVLATGRLGYGISLTENTIQDERLHFSNEAPYQHRVTYYVSLYNGGNTNLYLADMQDRLPRGFTYYSNSSYSNPSYSNLSGFYSVSGTGTVAVVYRSATGTDTAALKNVYITPSVRTVEDVQYVTFHFTEDTKGYSNSISYDENREMCYLKPGEAIVFYYACNTGKEADSDDAAMNVISMPYCDFPNAGVEVADSRTVARDSDKYTPNDGGCEVETNGHAISYGFLGGTADTQWLTSKVTVTRSTIKPGITKALTSTTDGSGNVTTNPMLVSALDTLTWTVTAENDGMEPITDYTLTDIMQYPYMFTGAVSYSTWSGVNASCIKPQNDCLFEILPGSTEDTLQLKSQYGSDGNNRKTLTIGGDPVSLMVGIKGVDIPYYSGSFRIEVAVSRDPSGNAVLSIHLKDVYFAIPEKGRGVLTLSTKNTRNVLENRQFVNACFITPMKQSWDGTANKGNVTTLETPYADGALPAVRNSAPVTTSYGYVTSSLKRITEVENPANTAACTDDPNYIVLSGADKLFNYTISVENSTPSAMDKLILIDGLPDVDDHTAFLASDPRFSEFKVSLAENPNFTVTVADRNGTVTALAPESYTVEYSTQTEFTAEDWNGSSTWSGSAAGARSVRLRIYDETGTLIPAGSTVSLTFTCRIDDPAAQPGQVAWNSFGYHYSLYNDVTELEAAPLKVGVKIPSVPQLKKQVVDHSGQPISVTEDSAFSFLLYPGTALNGTYETEEALTAALTENGIPYETYTVTVGKGESLSENLRLMTEQWTWTSGQKYTITELPLAENFAFKSFNSAPQTSYTFTYDPAQVLTITCENIFQDWAISLTKVDDKQTPLEGAVFALYSPNADDLVEDAAKEYSDLPIEPQITRDKQSWYLVSVGTTGEDGALHWTELRRENYYLLEVKAPDGYYLPDQPGQLVQRQNEVQGVCSCMVVNHQGYELPESGGTGIIPYIIGGLMVSACGFLSYIHAKRRREDSVSS